MDFQFISGETFDNKVFRGGFKFCRFHFCDFRRVEINFGIQYCEFVGCQFEDVDLKGVLAWESVFKNCRFNNCNLKYMTGNFTLSGCDFTGKGSKPWNNHKWVADLLKEELWSVDLEFLEGIIAGEYLGICWDAFIFRLCSKPKTAKIVRGVLNKHDDGMMPDAYYNWKEFQR